MRPVKELLIPGVRGKLPREVTGIAIDRKADVLFFLHAFNLKQAWKPRNPERDVAPVLFKYVVHYADGSTADVPVRYGLGADHWISKEPAGLKDAMVAWSAPLANGEPGDRAAIYQMQWNNPHPELPIASVDLAYDRGTGGHHGVPVLLGITAATAQ